SGLRGRRPLGLEGAPSRESLRRQAGVPGHANRVAPAARHHSRTALTFTRASPIGDDQMSPTATAKRPSKKAAAQSAQPGGYAGKLRRVNLSTGKVWTQPWGAEEMRERLGGI